MAAHSFKTFIYAALVGKLLISVSEFARFTGSSAMLSEAIHSLAGTGNQGLLLDGMRQAAILRSSPKWKRRRSRRSMSSSGFSGAMACGATTAGAGASSRPTRRRRWQGWPGRPLRRLGSAASLRGSYRGWEELATDWNAGGLVLPELPRPFHSFLKGDRP